MKRSIHEGQSLSFANIYKFLMCSCNLKSVAVKTIKCISDTINEYDAITELHWIVLAKVDKKNVIRTESPS